jgi:hypothetical protein
MGVGGVMNEDAVIQILGITTLLVVIPELIVCWNYWFLVYIMSHLSAGVNALSAFTRKSKKKEALGVSPGLGCRCSY